MTVLDLALADMRDGRRVMLIVEDSDAIRATIAEARRKLAEGEQARSVRPRITGRDGGWIVVCTRRTPGTGRGLSLDRVYFDHTRLYREIAPCMVTSTAPGPRFVHGPD